MIQENIPEEDYQEEYPGKDILGRGIKHPGARPMKVVVDKDGCWWLCDEPVDPDLPYEDQKCWRCKDMAFTRND